MQDGLAEGTVMETKKVIYVAVRQVVQLEKVK
jgi:hypothetical protein